MAQQVQGHAPRARRVREDENSVVVRGTRYTKLECVGRGGSSKVYKVLPMPHVYSLYPTCVARPFEGTPARHLGTLGNGGNANAESTQQPCFFCTH